MANEETEIRLGPDFLLEIVAIVQRGISEGKDVSQLLRDLRGRVEAHPGGWQQFSLSRGYVEMGRREKK